MIFRLARKLATKIKEAPRESLPLDPNPFPDRSAHLFSADREQYIILANTASLYSSVMFGRGITDGTKGDIPIFILISSWVYRLRHAF